MTSVGSGRDGSSMMLVTWPWIKEEHGSSF